MAGLAYIYTMPKSYSLKYSSLFSLLFLVCNVAIFVNSGYLDKKLIVLCHNSLPSRTDWENILSVVGKYNQFDFLFKEYPQKLMLRGALHHWYKRFPVRILLHTISCVHTWTHLLLFKEQKYLVVLFHWWS